MLVTPKDTRLAPSVHLLADLPGFVQGAFTGGVDCLDMGGAGFGQGVRFEVVVW